jgi:hypothetical protein
MKYKTQREVQSELDARLPRGPRGDPQNEFRCGFYFFRSQGYSFDASVERATSSMREHHPEFLPTVAPPSVI